MSDIVKIESRQRGHVASEYSRRSSAWNMGDGTESSNDPRVSVDGDIVTVSLGLTLSAPSARTNGFTPSLVKK